MNGCLRRARELLFWPRINAEVTDFVSKCSICQSFPPEQCREDLQPHEMPSRPWSKVGAYLFELGQQNFLILVDYWSSYFEVQELKRITSTTVITACKVQFTRHGIPDVLITDNGQKSVKEGSSRQQRSTASFLGLEKHAHRGSRNLACPASYG